MPKILVQDKVWRSRLDLANRYYKEWSGMFKCDILEKYYEGHQWRSQENLNYNPYVINKVFETVEIKISEFIPTFPKFLVESIPSAQSFDFESAANAAQLKQDVLNTLISNPHSHFVDEIELAYRDAFFRFGIVEVGYDADWILNPNVPKPLTKSQTDLTVSGTQRSKIVKKPEQVPANERIYFKRVNPAHFRVGGSDHRYLSRCGWVGYYEYVYKEDVLAMKNLLNRNKIEIAQSVENEPNLESSSRNTSNFASGLIKIWHLWDLRSIMRIVLLDSPCVTIFQRGFKRLNLFDYRPIKRAIVDGFYPIPAVFHWLSPQDEINETREMLRAHRRRFVRKFQAVEGTVDVEEIEKFETGADGAIIIVKRENAITPIDNADLGNALAEAVQTSADDLNRISGTSDQERGISDRGTATEANIIQNRGAVRENKERDRSSQWLAEIGRETLLTARDKFTIGIWIKDTQPEGQHFLGTVSTTPESYKWVASEQLENDQYDYKITVDLVSMSAAAQEDEKKHFLEFLSVLNQFPMIAFSPILVAETAYRCGYRNMKVIREFQKMALLQEMARMNQLNAAANPPNVSLPQPGGNQPSQIVQAMTPPTGPAIQKQLGAQLTQ